MTDPTTYAATVLQRCDELGAISEEEGRLTRRFATPALREAGEIVRGWMEAAGMTVRRDAVGNLIGRLAGPDGRTLLIGSHVDTVRDAGRYDGTLGVLIGIACAELVGERRAALPYALEVLAFADEEGTRYGTSYLGSRAFIGSFDEGWLERRDADGVRMREALRAFGGAPDEIAGSGRDSADLIGYYEVHIEQGPALESQGLSLGVVTAIAGQTGATVTFAGTAGHAGTVPMSLRRDALTAAAEWILAVERLARERDGLVATVGRLALEPGAGNVIPGSVELSLDLRHAEDSVRIRAGAELRRCAEAIAAARGLALDWRVSETAAVSLSPELTEQLAGAVAASGRPVVRLASGAGHDAAILSRVAPGAMLFVRCAGGVSHNPAESVTLDDVAAAIDVTTRFVESPEVSFDVLIRGAVVVGEGGQAALDVGVADGGIAELGPELAGPAQLVIEADGLHLFAGVIDGHVHMNEPGRADWEGFETGTRALAAGGATAAIDMPLNAHPPTVSAAAFDQKRRCLERSALVDIALWGGLVPGGVEAMDELAARGVVGFKAFMCASGIDDFPGVDELTLYEGMQRAAALRMPVAVHAESEAITAGLARRARAAGATAMRDFLASRPAAAELEAIARAVALADATGCALHVVHVSTGRGVAHVAAARARGVDVSCETCPHYLVLTEEDAEALGPVAKCAPPLRAGDEVEALWRALADGTLPMVASDHSPAPWALKEGDDLFAAWGGISGCQTLLALLLSEGWAGRGLPLELIAHVTSGFVARRFGLLAKGRLQAGADADLVLVDLSGETRLSAHDLHYRHRHSPFLGRQIRARVVRTLVRGRTVFADGHLIGPPSGRLLIPTTETERA